MGRPLALLVETGTDRRMKEERDVLTRRSLARALARRLGLSEQAAEDLVNLVLDTGIEGLVQDRSLKIAGFGTFLARHRKERLCPGHLTGITVALEAHTKAVFRESLQLRKRLNTPS